ncbi:hypothetical protein ACHAXR_008062, partial [Thalassiosira sp. AJA248-18]
MDTPCPPFYAEPTHAKTLLFTTASYARNYNDWYQCIEGAYCNTPSFLRYNPPGVGELWEKAWIQLDEGYPCNPALETSSSVNNGNDGVQIQGFELTGRPTNKPTRRDESPSLISGVVWYDVNGDGRKNTLENALTLSDYDAASKEQGAGLSNMKITLRECNSDKLLGVTYSFPRATGLGGEGAVEVIDASYLELIEAQEQQNSQFSNIVNDGLGVGNTEGKLGYYSFRILPFDLPGEFYVVFESPEGYRLTGGSGDYWEVYRAAMYDDVQPLMEAPANRHLQNEIPNSSEFNPDERLKAPINHSGYYARSGCFSIQQSPTFLPNIDAGLIEDSWPLVPYQYASLVVTIKFFSRTRRRRRKLQLVDSLECRKYQKLKSEGVEVEDIWGCDTGSTVGGGPKIEYKELTLDEGEEVIASLKAFLDSRVNRVWTIKSVGLAHQKMTTLVGGDDDRRRLSYSSAGDQHNETPNNRNLQENEENVEEANLELGFRIRGEYSSDKSGTDLSDVIISAIQNGADSFLSGLRGMPGNVGGVEVRDILWQPVEAVKEDDHTSGDTENIEQQTPQSEKEIANDGVSMGMLIGIIAGCVVFIAIIFGLLIYRRRKKKGMDSSSDRRQSMRRSQAQRDVSGEKKWWQRKKKDGTKSKSKKAAPSKKRRGWDEESEYSSDFEDSDEYDDDDSDISSRFFSDSSKFDPTTRAQEVGGYGDDGLEDYDEDDLSSQFYSSDASSDGSDAINSEADSYQSGSQSYSQDSREYAGADSYLSGSQSYSQGSREYTDSASYETGLRSSNASGFVSHNPSMRSSATSGKRSRKSKGDSMRSSASRGQSSMGSSDRKNGSSRTTQASDLRASDLYSSR